MRHDFLEDEEEELKRARIVEFQASEEAGFGALSGAVAAVVAAAEIGADCESPIEFSLGGQLKLMVDWWNRERRPPLDLVPQYHLSGFRYDFGLLADGGKLIAAIECDGKAYHNSEAARANDAAKDAAVMAAGAKIFRFTGSEIFRGARECAWGVCQFLHTRFGWVKPGAAA
jgi:very-short-patch-repair endonuclease